MKITRWFYMGVTKGKNRCYSRVELLGRMYRAGFEVVDERFHMGEYVPVYPFGRLREDSYADRFGIGHRRNCDIHPRGSGSVHDYCFQ